MPLGRGEIRAQISPAGFQSAMDELRTRGDEDLRSEISAIEQSLGDIFEAAGDTVDLGCDAVQALEGMSDNVNDNATRVIDLHSRLAAAEQIVNNRHAVSAVREEILEIRQQSARDVFDRNLPGRVAQALLSDRVMAQIMDQSGITGSDFSVNGALRALGGQISIESEFDVHRYLGALVTTDAGWDPFVTRQPGHTPAVSRPLQVVDTIPMSSTMQHSIKYMIQVLRVSAAKAVAEGAASAESSMQWFEYDEPMREIVSHIPVTEIQLEDEPQIRAIIDADLRLMVLQDLDGQLLLGDGNDNKLRGMVTGRIVDGTSYQPVDYQWSTSGSGAARRRSDTISDMKKAKTKLKLTGRVMPNVIYMHDEIWDEISLRETASAGYYLGSPANEFQPRIWGLPLVLTDHLSAREDPGAGTLAVIADTAYMRHWSRRSIHTEIGRITDQFIKRQLTIRAGLRCLLQLRRPAAVLAITMPT